jgi:hypothetical protein
MGGWKDEQVDEYARALYEANEALEADLAASLDLEAGLREIVGENPE